MSFWTFFSKKKKPVPPMLTGGLCDIVKYRIEQLVNDIVWSGDTTFASRDEVLAFVCTIVNDMLPEPISVDSTSDAANNPLKIMQKIEKIEVLEEVVRTKLKPLTFTKNSDTVTK